MKVDKNMKRREFSSAVVGTLGAAALSLAVAPAAHGQPGAPVEGKDFAKIVPPLSLPAGNKIVVYDFFSYACPHCNAFGPELDAWAKRLPADVTVQHVPVPFLVNAENFQRTYYALEAMGQVDAMHRKVFAAVHVDRMRFDKPADIAAFMSKNGIDGTKFLEMFNSFSVQSKVRQATQLVQGAKLDGVPALAIQGKYLTSPSMAGAPDRALAVSDYLIQQSRGKAS